MKSQLNIIILQIIMCRQKQMRYTICSTAQPDAKQGDIMHLVGLKRFASRRHVTKRLIWTSTASN